MRYTHAGRHAAAIVILCAQAGALAQSPPTNGPPADELKRASALFAQQDWAGALAAYSELAKAYPTHALSRFRVGVSLVELGRFEEGETNLRQGEKLGMPAAQSAYRLAQVFAERRRPDDAIRELRRAAAAGLFVPVPALNADKHLASLQANTAWTSVTDAFDAIVRPCAHDARYREFDFWLGDWDVKLPNGKVAGTNNIQSILGGCVLQESWKGAGKVEGHSFNIYDASTKRWHQTWVDNGGLLLELDGGFRDGKMVLEGETLDSTGAVQKQRITWEPLQGGKVRQHWQQSTDGGSSWTTLFDGTYTKRR